MATIQNTKTRDLTLDGLRAVGLLGIIVAHVGAPPLFFQLRNFDVVLMVLVSGSVFNSSSNNLNYFKFLAKRIYRLLIPTWLFLVFFFLFFALVSFINQSPFPYSSSTILSSFLLGDGIGYFWIIRVFLIVALILPFIFQFFQKTSSRRFLAALLAIYLVYELLYLIYPHLAFANIKILDLFFKKIIFYAVPFACVAGFGLMLKKATRKFLFYFSIAFLLTTAILVLIYYFHYHRLVSTQLYKYPPRFYYLSYGLFVSCALYFLATFNFFKKIIKNRLLGFIGASSMWIYLWHIFFLQIWQAAKFNLPYPSFAFLIEFLTISSASILIAYLQQILIKYFNRRVFTADSTLAHP